jgi:hypothetical protein
MMSEISLPEGVELTSVLNDLQDQPVLSCSVTRASLEIDDPVIGEDGEEVTDDAEASADSSQTDESQEEESNDN